MPIIMGFKHFRYNGRLYLAAKLMDTMIKDNNQNYIIYLYRWASGIIQNGMFMETGFPPYTSELLDDDSNNPRNSYWINPDGKGPGTLTLDLSDRRWKFVRAPTTPIKP